MPCCAAVRSLGLLHARHATLLVGSKNPLPRPLQYTNTKTADKTFQTFDGTCMLLSGAKASQANSSTNLANFQLEDKMKLLHEALRTQKYSFVVV